MSTDFLRKAFALAIIGICLNGFAAGAQDRNHGQVKPDTGTTPEAFAPQSQSKSNVQTKLDFVQAYCEKVSAYTNDAITCFREGSEQAVKDESLSPMQFLERYCSTAFKKYNKGISSTASRHYGCLLAVLKTFANDAPERKVLDGCDSKWPFRNPFDYFGSERVALKCVEDGLFRKK
jgi:hypothetical protein